MPSGRVGHAAGAGDALVDRGEQERPSGERQQREHATAATTASASTCPG